MDNNQLAIKMKNHREKLIGTQINTWGDSSQIRDGFIPVYYMQLHSKYQAIECLLKANCIDSIPIIVRSYLENFAILQNLILSYNQEEKYAKTIDELARAQISQDISIGGRTKTDYYINYLKSCYKYLIDKPSNIADMLDKDVVKISKQINKDYQDRIKSKDIKGANKTVSEALEKNDFINGETKFVYPYLCNISHANFAAIINRSYNQQGSMSFNCNSEDLYYIVDLVINCLEDVVAKMLCCLDLK